MIFEIDVLYKCNVVDIVDNGLHTFMVIYDKSKKLFKSYNGYNYTKNPPYRSNESLKNLVYSSWFIIGYNIQ